MESAGSHARVRRFALRHAPLVAILLLCVLFIAALGSGPEGTGVSLPTVRPTAPGAVEESAAEPATPPTPTPTAAPTAGEPPAAFGYVLGALLVLTVLSLLLWLVRLWLRRARRRRWPVRVRQTVAEPVPGEDEPPGEEEVRDQVRTAVNEGLRATDDGDPRRVVIACWVRLEQVAASAGTVRQPGDTPADLVSRLLDGHEISAESLGRLAELYRRARYAPDDVAESMREEARHALSALAIELEVVDS